MKLQHVLPVFALVLCFACKKSSDDPQASGSSDVYVKANIEGQAFAVGAVQGAGSKTGSYASFSKSENKLYVYGTATTQYLTITVQDFPKKTGTYSLGDASLKSTGGYVDNTDSKNPIPYLTQNGRIGSITVSSFDGNSMSGTFSYTTYSNQTKKEIKVASGEFKVPYAEF